VRTNTNGCYDAPIHTNREPADTQKPKLQK
jgi:hypothetical protein